MKQDSELQIEWIAHTVAVKFGMWNKGKHCVPEFQNQWNHPQKLQSEVQKENWYAELLNYAVAGISGKSWIAFHSKSIRSFSFILNFFH